MNCPIYLVDDDPAILDSVTFLLEGEDFQVSAFLSAKEFLDTVNMNQPGVILLDINMPRMDGLELQKRIESFESSLVIVFLTGHADVETTKLAFKRGAHDLLQKPVQGESLCQTLQQAQTLSSETYSAKQQNADLESKVKALTEREKSLIPLIIEGKPNKAIANELCIALRTVEIHRHNVFKKMAVSSGIQLAFEGKKLLELIDE
ncbi:response regulator transcription factor [Vibrio gigantis]|uniref:response regulator transcription factor n=1 Tax=Vibrio gigantis TaxID=296199 RepID=UPI001BFDB99F|nr:response regulator [Vibrio gigantis]